MELRDLEVAIAVADSGSVTRAATQLHMSPSSVSQIVSRLEAQLGGRLFYRLARGMALTPTGEVFIGPARRTLSEAAAVIAAVAETEGLESARIRVAPLRTMTAPIASLVAAFERAHPGVVVTLEAAKDDADIAELVKNGDCEIGFMRSPVTVHGLDATVVGEERLVVLVPHDLPLSNACSATLRDLDDQPMVGPPSGTALRERWDELFESAGVKPRMVAETLEHDTTLELVRAGAGIALTSMTNAARVEQHGVKVLPISPHYVSTICAVVRSEPISPALIAFRDLSATFFNATAFVQSERSVHS